MFVKHIRQDYPSSMSAKYVRQDHPSSMPVKDVRLLLIVVEVRVPSTKVFDGKHVASLGKPQYGAVPRWDFAFIASHYPMGDNKTRPLGKIQRRFSLQKHG